MASTGETQVSLTDPDVRAMAITSKQPRLIGYNVQAAVETKHHLSYHTGSAHTAQP